MRDLGQRPVPVARVVVVVRPCGHVMDVGRGSAVRAMVAVPSETVDDGDLGGRDPGPHDTRDLQRVIDVQAAKGGAEGGLGQPGVEEGPEQHVAGSPREAVDKQHP